MLAFISGLIVGAIIGAATITVLTMGKISDLQDRVDQYEYNRDDMYAN